MPSKDRDRESPSIFEDDPGDFLQDPELWVDQLPQPFRMIDEILLGLLENAWDRIETREVERRTRQARVSIPEVSDASLLADVEGIQGVTAGRNGLVFVGCTTGLCVFDANTSKGPQLLARKKGMCVKSIAVGCSRKELHILAAVLENGEVNVFAYTKTSHLVILTELFNQQESKKTIGIIMAPTCSHLAITMHSPECGYHVEVYKLPVDSWHQELQQNLVTASGEENQSSMGSRQKEEDVTYSKATLLLVVNPPNPISPCTTNDPATALQSVCDHGNYGVSTTGEHHLLTQSYFDNRRKAFVSQRADFVSEQPSTRNTSEQSLPTCHFTYFKNTCRQALPFYLAVWWKRHTQLSLYTIEDNPKGVSTVPKKVLPQGSVICTSALSLDTGYLAVGLCSGIVNIWNLRTGICNCSIPVTSLPDEIATLEFFYPSLDCQPDVVVGTSQGRVLSIHSYETSRVASVGQRVSKQQEVYGDLFRSSGYDCSSKVVALKVAPSLSSVVTSVHADGSITMWNCSEGEAICRLKLPRPEFTIHNSVCTLSRDGRHVFIAGKTLEKPSSPVSLFCTKLHNVPYLTPLWCPRIPTDHPLWDTTPQQLTMMEAIEKHQSEFTKIRYGESTHRRKPKRWKEYAKELQRTHTVHVA